METFALTRRVLGIRTHRSRAVGEDASGSFGLWAHHERFMTALVFGLARYRRTGEPWQYLALPGALAYFLDNNIHSARRYIRSDYNRTAKP